MNADAERPTKARSRLTPLSIIAMFLSLSEAVGGLSAVQTKGGLQIALVVFVILFPILIAAAFFHILWHRPYVFYSPHEYGSKTDVTKFVEAMRHKSVNEASLLDTLDEKLRMVLTSQETQLSLRRIGQVSKASTMGKAALSEDPIGEIADRMAQAVRDHFVILEAGSEFGRRAGRYSITYHPTDPIWRVGNELYYLLEPEIQPYTLGTQWALFDAETGLRMTSMESEWSSGKTEFRDIRRVSEVGVRPGMVLRAEFLANAERGSAHKAV